MQMQAKFSVGNDCLRSPQVTSGNLPERASNLREASTMRVRVDFFKASYISFHPVPTNLFKVNIYCLQIER